MSSPTATDSDKPFTFFAPGPGWSPFETFSAEPESKVLVKDAVSGGWDCPCPAIMRVIGAIVALAALVCMVVFPWVGIPFGLGYAILVILSAGTALTVAVNLTL